jgi:hypothetical protein
MTVALEAALVSDDPDLRRGAEQFERAFRSVEDVQNWNAEVLARSQQMKPDPNAQLPLWVEPLVMEDLWRAWGKNGRAAEGDVYFAVVPGPVRRGDKVKIGTTTQTVRHRLKDLGQLQLLRRDGGGKKHESELHGRFAAYRIVGEWFRIEGELADYLGVTE